MSVKKIFPTLIYHSPLLQKRRSLRTRLFAEFQDVLRLDKAGAEWSSTHYVNGFTSYASANELHRYYAAFTEMEGLIDRHVKKFCASLMLEDGRHLRMSTCWINQMPANTHHGMHTHPLSVISGTLYLDIPARASPIKFEDPRLSSFMARPPVRPTAPKDLQPVYVIDAKAGDLVLFESWLRHEVPINRSRRPRLSISFNYDLV